MRRSIQAGMADPAGAAPYIRQHAREMDENVLRQHVEMFVNPFSLDLGEQGRAAVAKLEEMAKQAGVIA